MKRNANCENEYQNDSKAKRLKTYQDILLSNRICKRKGMDTKLRNSDNDNVNWSYFNKLGFNYDPEMHFEDFSILKIGNRNTKCMYCGALKFKGE